MPYSLNTRSAHPSGIGLLMPECRRGFKERIKQAGDVRIDAESDNFGPKFFCYGKQKVDNTLALPGIFRAVAF
ncbi:hypothetical protein ACFQ3K_04860 [Brucella gallinifaecis]|uniref:Uncharacterized protein n=1 Tax=Brucella gallinifaecis TaxID=215590 RepID=A0A502BQJ3_9HYPH|nr:hypothetical protein [Brucella gallinifaecis]TPF76080.1 hypothetical protein FHY56_05285 [Brucella gallinifaecis]